MEIALYYTFSTIAQTLGASIALLAAFLLYRLQSLNSTVDKHIEQQILQQYSGTEKLHLEELAAQGKHADVVAYTVAHPPGSGAEHVATPRLRIQTLLARRKSLFASFWLSLWLTVGLVMGSVAALISTPSLHSSTCMTVAVFSVGSIWFLACLLSYASLIRKSLF